MKRTAFVETGIDGSFRIFTPDSGNMVIGEGATIEEAKTDFENSIKERMATWTEDDNADGFVYIEFKFRYDLAAFFNEFSCINISRFAEFAGVFPSTMRMYARGIRPVSKEKAEQIEKALYSLGRKLQAISIKYNP